MFIKSVVIVVDLVLYICSFYRIGNVSIKIFLFYLTLFYKKYSYQIGILFMNKSKFDKKILIKTCPI